MSNKDVVRQILERERKAMKLKDIVERARGQGLLEKQVGGALYHLKQDGVVESVKWGIWRIVAAPQASATRAPAERLDVTGLTSALRGGASHAAEVLGAVARGQ